MYLSSHVYTWYFVYQCQSENINFYSIILCRQIGYQTENVDIRPVFTWEIICNGVLAFSLRHIFHTKCKINSSPYVYQRLFLLLNEYCIFSFIISLIIISNHILYYKIVYTLFDKIYSLYIILLYYKCHHYYYLTLIYIIYLTLSFIL